METVFIRKIGEVVNADLQSGWNIIFQVFVECFYSVGFTREFLSFDFESEAFCELIENQSRHRAVADRWRVIYLDKRQVNEEQSRANPKNHRFADIESV